MSRKILGLDIRSASATAVLIETGLKKTSLAGYIHTPFNGEGEYHDRLSGALETVSREFDLKDCLCVLSMPSNRFFYRNLAVPFHENKKIQQMLPFELESAIPFSVEDLLIDFKKLPLPVLEGETKIVAAGIEISRLQSFIGTVEANGITPNVLIPGGYAMATWISKKAQSHENLLLVDYDGEDCALYLILSGGIAFIRSFPLPPTAASNTGILWDQIRRSIAGFESLSEVKATPDNILVNGFDEDAFPAKLESNASIPVKILDVMPPVGTEGMEGRDGFLPRSCFNAALASSLLMLESYKGMNFRKGPLAAKSRLSEYRDKLKKTGILLGVVILLWFVYMLTDIRMTQKMVDQLDEQIMAVFKQTFPEKKPPKGAVMGQMRAEINALKKAAFASGDTGVRLRSVDILEKISKAIPKETEVHFSKFNLNEDGVTITGTTDSYASADDIKTRLEKVEGFFSIGRSRTEKDGDKVRFSLKIQMNQEEES